MMTSHPSRRPAIFIDRDGTIIRDVGYLNSADAVELFEYSRDALQALKSSGFLIVVLSNQSGIGRGLITEPVLEEIHRKLNDQVGHLIDAFYFCPHLPSDGCECRKPGVGMLRRAVEDLDIDKANSWMIGDKLSDVQLGFKSGIATALVLTGYGESELPLLTRMPDIVAGDLLQAAREIISRIDQ